MAKPHAGAERDQVRNLRHRQGVVHVDPEPVGGPSQQGHVANGFGSGDEQQALRLQGKSADATQVALLQLAGHGPGIRKTEAACHLDGGQRTRKLEQGQGVATSLGDDPVPHTLVERAGDD